jgi:hypothetical protein
MDLSLLLAGLLLVWKTPVELVRDLSDDSAILRERAAAELYRQGEEVRGVLIDARDRGADSETRARAKDILRRLDADDRIRWFGGHNRVGGFAASIRTDRFFGSGPFRVTVEIMNVGTRDLEFPGLSTWDAELPDQELRQTGAEARVTVRRFGASGLRRTTWRSGETGVRKPTLLRPGDSARYETTLEARSLPAGDYQVSVEYFARDLVPDAEENLRTNSVTLMIRK